MRNTLSILLSLLFLAGIPTSARAATEQSEEPVVHSILFWSSGCPYCTQALTNILPAMQEKYNAQLSILLIELVSAKDIENLYALGTALGYSKEQVSVPFMLINHTALIGVNEIRDKFPGLIDEYLSAGGVDYANLSQVGEMLPKGVAFTSFKLDTQVVTQEAADTMPAGMAMAWGIMILMGAALIISILMIVRAFNGKPLGKVNRWLDITIPILSIIGLGAAIYLTYVEITHARALCGPVGDCNAVQSSPYAKLFGLIPIGLVGAFGYIAILVAWLWGRYRTDSLARIAGPAMYGMSLFGTLFSIYLTYLEIFVIHAVCIWCLSSAVIITALLLLNLPSITQWLAISEEEE
jgi:uncharacterized membrane protein/thiol-disulfide isomerase/thioredoxin